MHHEKARRCVKAYQILMIAYEYNHPIPQGYKGILKKKKVKIVHKISNKYLKKIRGKV
jgi:hypothetical protein